MVAPDTKSKSNARRVARYSKFFAGGLDATCDVSWCGLRWTRNSGEQRHIDTVGVTSSTRVRLVVEPSLTRRWPSMDTPTAVQLLSARAAMKRARQWFDPPARRGGTAVMKEASIRPSSPLSLQPHIGVVLTVHTTTSLSAPSVTLKETDRWKTLNTVTREQHLQWSNCYAGGIPNDRTTVENDSGCEHSFESW